MKLKCKFDRQRALPLILTGFVIILDQITKAIIATTAIGSRIWPSPESGLFHSDNILRIIHVRNTAIAFSIGHDFPDPVKRLLFVLLPVIVLVILVLYYLSSNEFTRLQRWAVAGILGGGIGNMIDRIFRPEGVVDFIDVRFFGILGFERWPTFNVADTSVVVSCILLLITIIAGTRKSVPDYSVEEQAKE